MAFNDVVFYEQQELCLTLKLLPNACNHMVYTIVCSEKFDALLIFMSKHLSLPALHKDT